jgi:ferritin-like protein
VKYAPPITLPSLSEPERSLVATTWAFRARSEQVATKRFRELTDNLIKTDALPEVVQLAREAIEEESRHEKMCREVATSFGWDFTQHQHEMIPLALAPKSLSLREQVLYDVVAFCCISESINAALLVEVIHFAKAPQIVEISRSILKDEIKHSRLGWAHLSAECSQGIGAFLPEYFVKMLETAGAEEVFDSRFMNREGEALAAYGELSYSRRTGILVAVLRDVILPGFEGLGLDISSVVEKLVEWETNPAIQTGE